MSNESHSLSVGAVESVPWYRPSAPWLLAAGTRIKNLLVYSTAYLVITAMVESVIVIAALDLSLSVAPVVIGLLTFSVYAGDRIADIETDELTNPGQTAFVRRHKSTLSLLTAGAYGLAIAISLAGGPAALVLTLLPGGFWVLYASDWLPRLGAYVKRLKDVLIVNSALVALAWAITLTILPLVYVDGPVTVGVAVLFAYFFLDRFINTEIPNIQDRAGDAAIGVSTLPVVFGERRTRHILYALSLALLALVLAASAAGVLPTAFALALAVGVAYTLTVTAAIGRTAADSHLTIASELKHLVVFAVLLAQGPLPL
jgi:4-hydroxybenzoate polyprenyltransferase